MASEPIMWVRGGNYQPPQISRHAPDGELIVEKYPATAKPPDDHPLHGQKVRRWELMIDEAGNAVRAVYSGGAADYQVDHPNYGAAIKQRHRKRGWFPQGACPLVLVSSGMLPAFSLIPELRTQHACEPGTYSATRPCRHALAEIEARKSRNARKEAKRADAFRGEAEKLARVAQENQKQQNDTLIDLVKQQNAIIQGLIGGNGRWPLERPNLSEEEFTAADKARHEENANDPLATEDELEAMLKAADADETAMVSPPTDEPPTDKKKRSR